MILDYVVLVFSIGHVRNKWVVCKSGTPKIYNFEKKTLFCAKNKMFIH